MTKTMYSLRCEHCSGRKYKTTLVDEMNQLNEDQSWTLYVDEDGVLTLPDELWEALDWGVGDNIEFIEQDDGSFLLIKTDQQEIDVDAEEVVDG
jgi:hypothetical protein